MITPRVPNWQHHSNKQPKYKKHVRIIQAAKKRTKQLIKNSPHYEHTSNSLSIKNIFC